MRYFRASQAISNAVRQQAMAALQQPNGRASEPWAEHGDFVAEGQVHIALAPHQYTGPVRTALIDAALAAGVEEISEAEYQAAIPHPQI